MDETPIFRAVKRRKQTNKQENVRSESGSDDENILHLVKFRTQPRARLKGVQFSNQKASNVENMKEVALTLTSSAPSARHGIDDRFVGSTTGQVVNVDKHMMTYIDQEMARKRQDSSTPVRQATSQHEEGGFVTSETSNEDEHNGTNDIVCRPEASYHQLAEVDLGSSTARIHQHGDRPKQKRTRKPRLGRDGKPFRPRPRKRRASDDIARDGLVEQVLHEHGLGTYDSAKGATHAAANRQGNDEAADERMAAEFQQQFLDAAAERQQQKQAKIGPGGAAKGQAAGVANVGGPRLGGGRSARARMAAMQAAEVKDGGARK